MYDCRQYIAFQLLDLLHVPYHDHFYMKNNLYKYFNESRLNSLDILMFYLEIQFQHLKRNILCKCEVLILIKPILFNV